MHVRFGAGFNSSSGLTGSVQLYDLSIGTPVSDSLLSTTAGTPTYMVSPDLGITGGSFEIQSKLGSSATGPAGSDVVLVNLARLEIHHD